MDVVWYCTVKRVSSMGLALSTSFRFEDVDCHLGVRLVSRPLTDLRKAGRLSL